MTPTTTPTVVTPFTTLVTHPVPTGTHIRTHARDNSSVHIERRAALPAKTRDHIEAPATTTFTKGAVSVRPQSRSTMMNVGTR
jgi:hypothetical protein